MTPIPPIPQNPAPAHPQATTQQPPAPPPTGCLDQARCLQGLHHPRPQPLLPLCQPGPQGHVVAGSHNLAEGQGQGPRSSICGGVAGGPLENTIPPATCGGIQGEGKRYGGGGERGGGGQHNRKGCEDLGAMNVTQVVCTVDFTSKRSYPPAVLPPPPRS
jgi:hypothetical protein